MFDFFVDYLIKMRFGGINALLAFAMTVVCSVLLAHKIELNLKKALILLAHAAVLFFASILFASFTTAFIKLFYEGHVRYVLTFCNLVLTVMYYIFFSKFQVKVKIIILSIFFTAIAVKGIIVTTASGSIQANIFGGALPEWVVSFAIEIVTIVGGTVYLKLLSIESVGHIQTYSAIFVLVICVLSFGLMLITDNLMGEFTSNVKLLITYASVVFYLFNLMYYFQLRQSAIEYSANIDLLALRQKDEINNEFYKISQANLEEMHRIRHDIKNQFLYMQVLFENKDYDGLAKYFSDLNNHVIVLLTFSDSGNKAVSAILYIERSKAHAAGLTIESKLVIPQQILVDDLDLNALLANLLDNAIEACIRDGISGGVIELFMRQQDSYLYITIKNPVGGDTDPGERLKLNTSKSDNRHIHGYGSKIVASVVKKYDGIIKYDILDGLFTVDIMLTLGSEKIKEESKINLL